MLFSSTGFLFIVAIIVIPIGGLIYWSLKEKMKVAFNISAGVGAFVGILLGVLIFGMKTNVVVIEEDGVERKSMLGTADFEFANGTSQTLPKLSYGDLVVNNTEESCIIKRFDYNEGLSTEEEELLSIGLMVKPQSFFAFHGKKIEYLFAVAPEYLDFDSNASSNSMIKFELHYLEEEDWETYYLYDGPVVDGIPNGIGIFYFTLTNYYEGNLTNAKFQGEGKMVYDETEWYEGGYVSDHRSGQGIYNYPDGSTYEGEWVNDEKEGYGIRNFANGDVYNGDYKKGEMHGNGKYIFDYGDYYEGEFEDGDFQGKGKWYYADTDTFEEGTWFEDEYIGE